MQYDVNHFIRKFENIPDELWCLDYFTDAFKPETHCALGHCGYTYFKRTKEGDALRALFVIIGEDVSVVNDSFLNCSNFNQKKPKARILAALGKIKAVIEQ